MARNMLGLRRINERMHGRAMLGVALAAVGASLVGISGLAGPTGTQLLLVFATLVALTLTRATPRD
jgi:hypothetical protein